jgi:hypothetical protein
MLQIGAVASLNPVAFNQKPFVYFIWKRQYLYIGETQRVLFERWGEHLETGFQQKLLVADEEVHDLGLPTHFLGIYCQAIDLGAMLAQRRTATQYVEHRLHVIVASRQNLLGTELVILSRTERTAPRFSPYVWADDLAEAIFLTFLESFGNARKAQALTL